MILNSYSATKEIPVSPVKQFIIWCFLWEELLDPAQQTTVFLKNLYNIYWKEIHCFWHMLLVHGQQKMFIWYLITHSYYFYGSHVLFTQYTHLQFSLTKMTILLFPYFCKGNSVLVSCLVVCNFQIPFPVHYISLLTATLCFTVIQYFLIFDVNKITEDLVPWFVWFRNRNADEASEISAHHNFQHNSPLVFKKPVNFVPPNPYHNSYFCYVYELFKQIILFFFSIYSLQKIVLVLYANKITLYVSVIS